jgi:hypothetical protein
MKSFFAVAFLVMFSAASFAQAATPSNDADSPALIARSKAVLEAVKTKDPAALNTLLAEDFHSIDMAGEFGSRQEMLGAAQGGFIKDFLFYEPRAVHIDDNSTIVTYNFAVSLSDEALRDLAQDNLTWPRYSKVSDLWVRQNGEWKLKFEQVTPVRAMY